MIQSERELIKRKKFSPCKKEECMRSKSMEKSIQKVIEEEKRNDVIYTQKRFT